MSGLTFLNPLFLFGMAALSIPIILHLMNREVPKRVVFPTIRFIMKGQQYQAGKKGLRDIFTLICRLTVLTAIVLLFAAPVLENTSIFTGNKAREVVLFVDLSASMRAVPDFGDYVQAGSAAAIKGDEQGDDTAVGVVASGAAPVLVLGLQTPAAERQAAIAALTPGVRPGNHYAALLEAAGMFSDRDGVVRELVIFSDRQQQDWTPAKMPKLPESVKVSFVSPPEVPTPNLAIQRVFSELFVQGESRRLRATVQVRNFSVSPATATLMVKAGERTVKRDIEVRPQYSERFVLDLENPVGHIAVAEVSGEQAYQLDDQYHFWIGPRPPLKVAVVTDLQTNRSKAIETFFLQNALGTTLPGMDKFELAILPPEAVWETPLTNFNSVILLDSITDYTEIEMELVKTFVNDGGSLIYLAGNSVADNVTKLSKNGLSGIRFLGFKGDASQRQSWTINSIDTGSPVLEPFIDEASDLRHFPIYKLARYNLPKEARALAAIDEQLPVLVQEEIGKGVVFISAVGLSPTWSDLPTSLSFVPLLRQLLKYRVSSDHGIIRAELGESAADELAAAGVNDAEAPAELGVHVIGGVPVEVNATRVESDLRRLESYEVLAGLSPTAMTRGADSAAAATVTDARSMAHILAWILIVAFFAELVAANARTEPKRDAADIATPISSSAN